MNWASLAPEQKVAIVGAVLTVGGAVLPWITAERGAIPGYEAEGFLTLMAAISVLGVTTLWDWGRRQMAVVALFGAIVTAIAVTFLLSFEQIAGIATRTVDPGLGVYVTVATGVLIGGSGIYGLIEHRRALKRAAGEERDDATGDPPVEE